MKSASLYVDEPKVVLLLAEVEESSQEFVGVRTLLVDVVAAVTAGQTLDGEREGEEACGQSLFRIIELRECATTASAGNEDLSLVFAVQIDEQATSHEV